MTNLERIVAEYNDESAEQKVTDLHVGALHSYTIRKHKSECWNDYLDEVTSFLQHYEAKTTGARLPAEVAQAKALEILNEINKKDGGANALYKQFAKKGKMHRVLEAISNYYENNHINAVKYNSITKIAPDDDAAHQELVKEAVTKLSGLIDKDKILSYLDRMKDDWQNIVGFYLKMQKQAKEMFESYMPANRIVPAGGLITP